MHNISQLPGAHKNTGLLTGASSSVSVNTRTLRHRKLHTEPNLAIFSVAWEDADYFAISQVLIHVCGIWTAD